MANSRTLEIAACTAWLGVTGCTFSPEQRLLPEAPMLDGADAAVTGPRGSTTSAAMSSSSSGASAPPPSTRTTASAATAAGSGGVSAQLDAGVKMKMDTGMPMKMETAGARATQPDAAASADAATTPSVPAGAQDPTCDLSGIWMSRQVAVGLALDTPQYLNTWGYHELEQSGVDVVVKNHIDCGSGAIGSGTATLSRATLAGVVQHNMQTGRKGRVELKDGKCELEMAHFWSVRGGEETRFLPNPTRDSNMSMAELMKLKPLPTPRMPEGAIDLENDGELGAAMQIGGIVSGVRNSVQRDWDRWFTAPGYEITPSMDFTSDVTVRIEYETEESVMAPTSGLLTTPTDATNDYDHIQTFRFLGRNADDARAKAIVKTDPVETCYAIQDAMPVAMLKP